MSAALVQQSVPNSDTVPPHVIFLPVFACIYCVNCPLTSVFCLNFCIYSPGMRKCKHLLCMQMKTKVLSVNELLYACKYVPVCLVPKIKEKEFHSAAGMNRVRQHKTHKTQTSACLFHVHHKCPGFPSKDGWARVRHSAPPIMHVNLLG